MRVLFCSECKGNAFKTTKQILNMVAVPKGSRSWTADITEKGLEAVHSELARKATRKTAVQCLVVNRKNQQRKWIVGDRSVFGPNGEYPVARTSKAYVAPDETTWARLPLVASLTAIAALLHDIGKLNDRFQKKLKGKGAIGDPVRHEYLSCMILREFVDQTGAKTDKEWIEKLPLLDIKGITDRIAAKIDITTVPADPQNPFLDMEDFPVFLSICWLILSHHRLPYHKGELRAGIDQSRKVDWTTLGYFTEGEAGYLNGVDPKDAPVAMKECVSFPDIFESPSWRKALTRYSNRLLSQIELYPEIFEKPDFLLLGYARISLIFGDHLFSSMDCRTKKNGPFANTIKENDSIYMNQTLEEHLNGVCAEAVSFAYKIPRLKNLSKAYDVEWLNRKSTGRFRWQEKAVDKISEIKKKSPEGGVFVVNMAGTGSGKTLANAKMLHALDGEGLRGTVALGLRTLTLQTGKEYRERMGLFEEDLCVAMGAKESVELKEKIEDEDDNPEPLIDYELVDGKGSELFSDKKDKLVSKFLGSPVLVCTLDQIIKAIESTAGGSGIIPEARIISSDLVIDEVDDYTGNALVSVGRLVYLAATHGRNVIISSATIPPEISLNLKYYYDEGYKEYSKWHNKPDITTGIVVDEYESATFKEKTDYIAFCRRHSEKILASPACRKGEIVEIPLSDEEKRIDSFNNAILRDIHEKHDRHCCIVNGKSVSFGFVRFANISQLVGFGMCLGAKKEYDIKPIIYHSRLILAYRHNIEEYLDRVLCRKNPDEIFDDPVIASHIAKAEKDVIFVVLASPVEEIGRDHDFDWSIIEPSSYRSIIQTSGRVQRHRLMVPEQPNIGILEYNESYLVDGSEICFCKPGFESKDNFLPSHNMFDLCDKEKLAKGITSVPRVLPKEDNSEPLAILEHDVTQQWLDPGILLPTRVSGYINGYFLTALPGKKSSLRDKQKTVRLIYKHKENGSMYFADAEDKKKRSPIADFGETGPQNITFFDKIYPNFEEPSWWLEIDHDEIVERLSRKMKMAKERFENRYCIIDIPDNSDPSNPNRRNFVFHEAFGLFD